MWKFNLGTYLYICENAIKSTCVLIHFCRLKFQELYKKYWTDKTNDALLCGSFLVTLESEEKQEEFVTRIFKLKKNEVSNNVIFACIILD